ncbi:MAG: hypothetical protein ACFCU3_02105 [Verrucomicrobiales bacterium]
MIQAFWRRLFKPIPALHGGPLAPAFFSPMLVALLGGFGVSCLLLRGMEVVVLDHFGALSAQGLREGYFWQCLTHVFIPSGWASWAILLAIIFFTMRELAAVLGPFHLVALLLVSTFLQGLLELAIDPHAYVRGPYILAAVGAACCAMVYPSFAIRWEASPGWLRESLHSGHLAGLALLAAMACGLAGRSVWVCAPSVVVVSMVAYVYLRLLGLGEATAWEKHRARARLRRAALFHMPYREFLSRELDPVLERLHDVGRKGLNARDREVLRIAQARTTVAGDDKA